ncbi:efflux RND transporter periplasmic adaptor subunit [Actimicrobium sp. GrIS 1.19]|uniref:efflux RND transporter periplasmic adaptor subunit n=1 Tax=Actimicrobium sp. GrIS 1.19 TaxID=3071708 RepID=UPI002E11F2E5
MTPRTRPARRTLIIGTLVALLALVALGGLAWYLTHREPAAGAARTGGGGGPGGGGGGRPNTTVGVATVEPLDLPVILDALGTVQAAATVTVRPQVGGVLQKILFREGEMVKAGQLLALIDPRQFEMALMQTTGQRLRDEAQLASAKVTLQRYQTLLAQDSIARQDVDTQAALVKQLEGTVVSDRANEGTARLNLGYSKIVAPISGRVGLRVVDVGNVVSASDANGVAVITQVTPIDVQFTVPQDQVAEVMARAAEGAALPVTALDRTRTTALGTGRFLTLDNQIDLQTGTVRAKARFANDKLALFPNQFVNVQLLLRTIKGAAAVPVAALRHSDKGDYVYVVNTAERTVALRPVTRGQGTIERIEITKGLQVGEKVVTEGADRLSDGAKITLAGDKPMAPGAGKGRRGARPAAADGTPAPEGERRRRPQAATAPAQ